MMNIFLILIIDLEETKKEKIMSVINEIKNCYIKKKGSIDGIIEKYKKEFFSEDEEEFFEIAVRYASALCAAPGVGTTKKLNYLAKDNEYGKVLKKLIHEYGVGIQELFGEFDRYFTTKKTRDFFSYSAAGLNLPEDWFTKEMPDMEIPKIFAEEDRKTLGLVKKYNPLFYRSMAKNWTMGMVYDYLECVEKDYKTEEEFIQHLKGMRRL